MAVFRTGNMWDAFDEADHFIITTNAVVKGNGALVMGAGIAKQVRDQFPGVDVALGGAINKFCGTGSLQSRTYGVLLGKKIGIFQVKHHYKDAADINLIRKSADILAQIAHHSPGRKFVMNFPGIGNGGLAYDDVKPYIEWMPDNIEIWTFN